MCELVCGKFPWQCSVWLYLVHTYYGAYHYLYLTRGVGWYNYLPFFQANSVGAAYSQCRVDLCYRDTWPADDGIRKRRKTGLWLWGESPFVSCIWITVMAWLSCTLTPWWSLTGKGQEFYRSLLGSLTNSYLWLCCLIPIPDYVWVKSSSNFVTARGVLVARAMSVVFTTVVHWLQCLALHPGGVL